LAKKLRINHRPLVSAWTTDGVVITQGRQLSRTQGGHGATLDAPDLPGLLEQLEDEGSRNLLKVAF